MIINHNMSALNAHRQLATNNSSVQKSLEKLSSGLKINRAGDDAAGLAISEKMRGQIKGLEMASKNAQDGISLIQTAEGALNETHAILQRMRELAVQSSNDTNTDKDRAELQKETDQLAQELSRISNDTEFNTQNLAGGGFKGTFHIGSNEGQSIELSINAMDAFSLGVARDTFSGTVADNTTGIGSVNIDATTGAGIADTATITATYNAGTVDAAAAGTFNTDLVITAANSGTAGNDIQVEILADASGAGAVTVSGNTITVQLGNGLTDNASIAAMINGNADASKLVSATGGVTTGAAQGATALTGGTSAQSTVTFDDGNGKTQTVNVNSTDTSVKVTSGDFKGLSFDLADGEALSDIAGGEAITIGTEKAASAVTNADGTMTKANAKAGINISDQKSADAAITTIQTAIDTVSAERSKLGAMQNRLEHTINNLGTSAENMTAAESRIRDVDYDLVAA